LVRSTKTEYRLRQRARIVLLAADGMATRAVARAVGCTTGTASKWRVRYAGKRLAGLDESGDRGADPKYTAETGRRILAVLDGPPPPGHARWTAPLIARALGDVHEQYVWRFLRAQKIDLAGRKSWCVSNDPEFAAKAAEIVGLYLDPPDGALVIAVDEKPHIQALERAQGYLRLPNGRALGGQAHHYKRHGTSTLFAALNLANGEITARHYKRRRRIEFLDFMNRIVEAPTHASWLNQIECWFSILAAQSLRGASFSGVAQLRKHIDAFVGRYNQTARPFAWTKSEVHQKRLKTRFADL
jgi:transposase